MFQSLEAHHQGLVQVQSLQSDDTNHRLLDMKNEKCIKIDPDLNNSFSDNSNCSDSEPSNQLGNFNVSTNSLSKDECLEGGSIDCPPVGGINPAMNISASLKVKGLKEMKQIITIPALQKVTPIHMCR